jgi:hypothetical protein
MQMKDSFNLLYLICTAFASALLLPFRERCGSEWLKKPAFAALILLIVWTTISQSPFMLAWLVGWLIVFALRRAETAKLLLKGVRIHSMWPGDSVLGKRFTKNDYTAKRFVEPLFIFVSGLMMCGAEADWCGVQWGLGRFMVFGACCLPLLEGIHRQVWQKRAQATIDAELEMEQLQEERRHRLGG